MSGVWPLLIGLFGSIVVIWAAYEVCWYLIDMPRFRHNYLAHMKQRFPETYTDADWPSRWPDKIYKKVSRS
jgi:hypothetical protein